MGRAARRTLSRALGRRPAEVVLGQVSNLYPSIAARSPIAGAGARDLLRTSSYVIALDQALSLQGLDQTRTRSLVADVVTESIMPMRTALYWLAGLRHRNPLDRARWAAGLARRFYYAQPDWVMEDVDVDRGFGFDVTRCVVADFFESFGMGDLCSATICIQDMRGADRHGVSLERTKTLSSGGSRCDFRYRFEPVGSSDRGGERRGVRPWRKQLAALTDSIEIDASPERVWAWLTSMADHYRDWHPDHLAAEWILGRPNEVGSRMKATERLAGHEESLTFEMTDVNPPCSMGYRILGPHSLLIPSGRFVIEARERGSVFTAEIDVRLARLVGVIFRRRLDALHTHMREEGRSLKRLIEEQTVTSV